MGLGHVAPDVPHGLPAFLDSPMFQIPQNTGTPIEQAQPAQNNGPHGQTDSVEISSTALALSKKSSLS